MTNRGPSRARARTRGALGIYLYNALTSKFASPPPVDGLWISCSLGCCEVQFALV